MGTTMIISAWQKFGKCRNCRQTYARKPRSCIAARHEVKMELEIKKFTTIDERKTELNRKSAEDGGLRLGSGIDLSYGGSWVGYNSFNN